MTECVPAPEWAAAILEAWPAGGAPPAIEAWRTCDSTMERARAWHARERITRAAVVASEQTRGRGRRGRRFVSPAGGLYVTSILPAPKRLDHSFRVGLAAAVAARRAIASCGGPDVSFDWPNDLVLDAGKVGGILSEMIAGPGRPGPPVILVGVGLNVGPDPRADEPVEAGPAARLPMPEDLARGRLAAELVAELESLAGAGDDDHGWRHVLECLESCGTGRRALVEIRRADGSLVSGAAVGIAWDGALRIRRQNGREVRVRYGELVRGTP